MKNTLINLSKIFTFKLYVTFQIVNYSDSKTVEEICEHSTKLITLIDLAGHHKYLKTTIFGLTGYCPDFAMLVVSANTGMGKRLLLHSFPATLSIISGLKYMYCK